MEEESNHCAEERLEGQARTEQDQHSDLEDHIDIILEEQSMNEKDALGNIIEDVLVIEDEIAIEASSIVSLASENLADHLFLLEPDDVHHDEEGWEISDDTNELTDILGMTDGETLQEELETSAITLVSQLPKTQSEVELAESSDEVISETESVTESSDAVSPLHVSAKRNAFVLTSEGSTDSDIVPALFPNSASSIVSEGRSAPLSEEDQNQSDCSDLLGLESATENIDAVTEITTNTDCDPGSGAGPSEAGWGASESDGAAGGLQNCTAAAASWIDTPGRASPALQSDPATDTASSDMAGRVAEPEEGWGDDIRLDTINAITNDQCEEDNLFCKDKDSELESWLEMKQNEFEGMTVKDGSESEDDEAVNISLFNTEDLSGIDGEVIIIEENNVIKENDNNALTNINGLLKEAPNISKIKKKRAIRSPILKRKEIKACINLHNACEDSDVLQEIIGPSVRFSEDTHNICEAVLDEDELTDEEEISSEVSAAPAVKPAVSPAEMSQLLTKLLL